MYSAAALMLVWVGLQLKFCLTIQFSGEPSEQVNLTAYYITDPEVDFAGDDKCMIFSQGIPPFRRCEGDPLTLTDCVTGKGSPLNLDQFIGWSSDKQGRFIFAPDFNMDIYVKQMDIYFHHSPPMGIGLPAISEIRIADLVPIDANSIGPIRFTYANNQYLSQNDNNTTMISVVITEDYVASLIDPYGYIRFDFNFSFHLVNQSLISEIRLFNESVSNVPDSEISFLPGNNGIELEANELLSSVRVSCTVANEGLFSWSWTGTNEAALDISHTSVFMADLTRTSILEIRNISLSDAGQYTCTASVFDGFEVHPGTDRSSNFVISAQGLVSTSDPLTTTTGVQNVSMMCDFSGYLPEAYTITWTGPQGDRHITANGDGKGQQSQSGSGFLGATMASSDRHTIVNGDGEGQSQSGGGFPGLSILSTLTISTVEEEDYGTYTCLMMGNNNAQLMGTVQLLTGSTVIDTPTSTDVTAETSQIPLIAGVVVGVLLLIAIVVVVVILVMVCALSKHKKLAVDLNDPPLYSEVGIKPAPPPIPSYFYNAANSGYAQIEISKNALEMHEIDSPTPFSQTKQDITAESPLLAKLSNNSTTMPSTFQDNPMYASADGLNRPVPALSAMRYPGSLPTLLDQQDESSSSNFNIYATAHPPPVPPYHGTPDGSLCEEEIEPALFRQHLTSTTSSTSGSHLAPYSSIYSNPQPLEKSDGLLEVTEKNIREIKELGMGQFGRVVLAHTLGLSLKQLKLSESNTDRSISIVVAVKRLKSSADNSTREAFEKEIKFMARLQHENVVRLVGVCLSKDAFIMMQYMENGDLNQYLRTHTLVGPDVSPLPDDTVNAPVLVYLSLQIASGMHYLANLRYIHRDLATRNCLVGQDFTVKIADFGMSRDLYDSYYYRISGRAILPIRWMANECFYGRFTEKTDVWAFGVTMWEIFTLCQSQPYGEMTDQEVIDNAVKGADRVLLTKPSSCSEEVYDVMKQCWIHEPAQRASFAKIYQLLHQIHACTMSS